jgi:hypothetical protein
MSDEAMFWRMEAERLQIRPCPGGCGCMLGTDDADRAECGCDGGCGGEPT